MMNLTTNPTTAKQPTQAAIDTAIKNAAKMEGYTIKQSQYIVEAWFVIKPGNNGRDHYRVNTLRRTCTCPAFENSGYCKHQVTVDEELRIREMEQAQEDYRDMVADHAESAARDDSRGMTYAQEREEEYRFDHDIWH